MHLLVIAFSCAIGFISAGGSHPILASGSDADSAGRPAVFPRAGRFGASSAASPGIGTPGAFSQDALAARVALARASIEYARTERQAARAETLLRRQFISRQQFEEEGARRDQARLTYEEALLRAAAESGDFHIDKAWKSRGADGVPRVHLVLRTERVPIGRGAFLDSLTPTATRCDVSLAFEGTIISDPYEAPLDGSGTLEFRLLRDVDDVTVRVTSSTRSEERRIRLQLDPNGTAIVVTAEQFSQEADLGDKVVYRLSLETFSPEITSARLSIEDLPGEIRWSFADPATGARISQLKIPARGERREIDLSLVLPEKPSRAVFEGGPIVFHALVRTDSSAASAHAGLLLKDREGSVALELVPRGVGRLSLTAENLYAEVPAGSSAVVNAVIRNEGSDWVGQVALHIEDVPGWTVRTKPERIEHLAAGAECAIELVLAPKAAAAAGEYEIGVRAAGDAGGRVVESQERVLRVHLAARSHLLSHALLVTLLLSAVTGTVVAGVRISRR